MSTEVGSLNADLTLDLSNFKAGMAEAIALAADLGAQLKAACSGDVGFSRMTADIMEALAQMRNLSASMEDFKASMAQMSGADLFAQMREHTAAMPGQVASVTSALKAADEAAIALGITIQEISAALAEAAMASQGFNLGEASSLNFSSSVEQLQQMAEALTQITALLERMNTLDAETGEITGSGAGIPAMYNLLTTVTQVNEELSTTLSLLHECASATTTWANEVRKVSTMLGTTASSVRAAKTATSGVKSKMNGASQSASKFASQTGKASSNLQSAKGYALSVKGILGGIVVAQAFYTLLNIMEELVNKAITFSETMQDSTVAFSYLFDDGTTSAEAFLNALKEIALNSPLETTDLTSAARKLMAMGFSADATVPSLQILTDTAAVFSNSASEMSEQIDSITLALGQMLASGTVSAQELRQLYNAGLPVYDLLADGLGITKEMAKNIGDYDIDSASAVYAILQQLQEKYAGAAAEMSTTFSGSMAVIKESLTQILSYGWSDLFDAITEKVSALAKYVRALVKITQAYGVGGLFQALFPESSWSTIRNFIGGLQQIGQALKQMGQIVVSIFGEAIQIVVKVGSVVLPILGNFVNSITKVARAALNAYPALKTLLAVIAALVIGATIAKITVFLAKAIWLLTGAKAAAKMIVTLISAIINFGAANTAVIVSVLALAAGFLAIVAASEKARDAIASFFGNMVSGISDFAESLDLGFDTDDILALDFEMPDTSEYTAGLEDLASAMDDVTDSTEDASDASADAGKNIQSFDEVFTVTDDSDTSSTEDSLSSISDALSSLDDLDYSDLFDWTGDWATDWGTLSAGLSDLGDLTSSVFDNLGDLATDFWETLSEALSESPEVTGALLGAAIGAVLGALVGQPLIGAAIGAVAGLIAGTLWDTLAEQFGLGADAAETATINSALGAAIGALIGGILGGGYLGAVIGAAIGSGLAGVGTLIWEKLQEDYNISDEAGEREFATAVGEGLLSGLATAVVDLATFIGTGVLNWNNVGVALRDGLKTGIITALASIGLSFLTDWIVGEVGEAVGASEDEIAQAEEWSSWGGTIGAVIGGIIGTVIAPGLGTAIGSLLGQLVGSLAGGALGLFQDEIGEFFDSAGEWIADRWDDLVGFFTDTVPEFFDTLNEWQENLRANVATFFTNTLPEAFSSAKEKIGEACSTAWEGVQTFFGETLPGWWDSAKENLSTFFTETVPDTMYDAGYAIGYAVGTAFSALVTFFTETLPGLWEDYKEWADNFQEKLREGLEKFFTETIPDLWDDFTDALKTFFTETIPGLWEDYKEWADGFQEKIREGLKTFFTETIPELWDDFKDALKTFFTETLPELWQNFLEDLNTFQENLKESLATFFGVTLPTKWLEFVEIVKGLGEDIIDGLVAGFDAIVGTVWDWITSFFDGFVQGFKDAFGIASPAKEMEPIGENILSGVLEGILTVASTIGTWLYDNVFTPVSEWCADHFTEDTFSTYGKNIMTGIQNGITSLKDTVVSTASTVFTAIKNKISEVFDTNSPSKVTEEIGENVDEGFIIGMQNLAESMVDNAEGISQDVVDGLTPEGDVDTSNIDLSSLTDTSLSSLQDWSTSFVTIISDTFTQIADLFTALSTQLAESISSISDIPTTINTTADSIAAADQLTTSTNTTGTTASSIIADITEATLDKMAAKVSAAIYEYIAPLFATLTSEDQSSVIAYIGTLIGDDAGYKELYRKLKAIETSEGRRS